MNYIYKDRTIRVEWSIYKGTTEVLENFKRANLKVFLIGPYNRYVLSPIDDADNEATVTLELPSGIPEGPYALEAIWCKNWIPDAPDFNPCDRPMVPRDISLSRTKTLFAITNYESEENISVSGGTVVVKVKTSVATYGYDGLDAYQIAVMSGRFTGTQDEWLDSLAAHMSGDERPDTPSVGMPFFDTVLGKPIWWNGTAWVDATGTEV